MEYAQVYAHIYDLAHFADTLTKDDIKLDLAEWRGYFILHHLYTGAVAASHITVLDLRDTTDIEAHGCIELEGVAAGSCFGVAEHYAYLLCGI